MNKTRYFLDPFNQSIFKVSYREDGSIVVFETKGLFFSSSEPEGVIQNFLESGFEELDSKIGQLHFSYISSQDVYGIISNTVS